MKNLVFLKGLENMLAQSNTERIDFSPKTNVLKKETGYILEIEIPGMEKEDIVVSVKDNFLTISGEKRLKNIEDKENYHRVETSYGKFSRSFNLGIGLINIEEITAVLNNGILIISLPFSNKEIEEIKKIEIK
jgi:HSP20 family protein